MDVTITEKANDLQIIESKRENWGKMGVGIHKCEIQFSIGANVSTSKLSVLPQTIEDIPAAQKLLKEVKADRDDIIDKRKKITSRLDEVKKRLMSAEASFDIPIAEYEGAIVKILQEKEKKDRDKKAKEDEIQQIRHQLNLAVARYDAEFKTLIAEKVNQAFTHALEKNIHPGQEIEDYIDRVNFRIKESHFAIALPRFSLSEIHYTSQEEFDELFKELFKINPSDYVALFATEIEKRFCDYNVAYNNKKQALEIARKEQEEKLKQIEEEKQSRVVSSELDSVATDMSVEPSNIKALKKCYKIQMPDTEESAITIMRAYVANRALGKAKITKWLNMVSPLITALEKMKNNDNNFQPQGLSFVETDKL